MCNNDCNNCPRQVCDCRPGILKENNKYRQALDEIEKYLDEQQKYFDGEDYHNLLDIINKVKEQ